MPINSSTRVKILKNLVKFSSTYLKLFEYLTPKNIIDFVGYW